MAVIVAVPSGRKSVPNKVMPKKILPTNGEKNG